MPDILHNLTIQSSAENVYDVITTPKGLAVWWTKTSSSHPELGAEYQPFFSDEYDWRAAVLEYDENTKFVLEITKADEDWTGTKVKLFLTRKGDSTDLQFEHTGWKETNHHFRFSSYCWAKNLRLLKKEVLFPMTKGKIYKTLCS